MKGLISDIKTRPNLGKHRHYYYAYYYYCGIRLVKETNV